METDNDGQRRTVTWGRGKDKTDKGRVETDNDGQRRTVTWGRRKRQDRQ